MSKYKDALEDMLWQFAYRGVKSKKPCLFNGGLSALEHAFDVMGWDNPHYVEEINTCDVEGCCEWYSCQLHWEGMYVCLCSEHGDDCFEQKPRPKLKQRTINREAKRDPITGILPMSTKGKI